MKLLSELLEDIKYELVRGDLNQFIASIHFDSRRIEENSLFIAVKGTQNDGHQYITQAIEKGAKAIVFEDRPANLQTGVVYLRVENTAKILGMVASNFYNKATSQLKIVAVTGTNGKTTTVTLLYHLFRRLGYKVGMLSTVKNQINDKEFPAQLTTPDPLQMHSMFAEMVKEGCNYCFMEASSHAIHQERIAGIHFTGAIFTNISHDHLDYHQTFSNYIKAKKKLFDELKKEAFALVNSDDKNGLVMFQNCKAGVQKTFALKSAADYKAKILENTMLGLLLEIDQQQVWFKLAGDFNAYNLLGIYAAALLLGETKELVLQIMSDLNPATGRFERLVSASGVTAIVDYAHTPDALKNVLMTLEQLKRDGEKIITVVGCGGNRDTTKRPVMGRIACEFSDQVIFTSDNPRFEDSAQIIRDMMKELDFNEKKKATVIEDRREAIRNACINANKNDIILVAGKGHENYQEIQGVKYSFDDRLVLLEYLK